MKWSMGADVRKNEGATEERGDRHPGETWRRLESVQAILRQHNFGQATF